MQKRIGHMYTLFGIHIHIIYIVQRGFGIMEVKISHNAHKVGISFVNFDVGQCFTKWFSIRPITTNLNTLLWL